MNMFNLDWRKRSILHGSLISVLVILFMTFGNFRIVHAKNPTTNSTMINMDLARFVAKQHVQKFYPGFQWSSIDHMVVHDINGSVVAYAFIFSKSSLWSINDLQIHVIEKYKKLNQIEDKINDGSTSIDQNQLNKSQIEEELYSYNDIATVITGATSNSKLILRHFRGLPDFWVEAQSIDETYSLKTYGKALQVFRIVMITPMDYRLVASEGIKATASTVDFKTAKNVSLPDSAQIIKVNTKKVETIQTVRIKRQEFEKRKKLKIDTLEPDKRERYEQAMRNRSNAIADRWDRYREQWAVESNEVEAVR